MTYASPDMRDLHAALDTVARPRYAGMTDPHDGNDQPDQPAIRLVNYMGDMDSYYEVDLVGPYPDVAGRNTELARLRRLPLGAPEYNGGYEFLPATMAVADRGRREGQFVFIVKPEQTVQAGTVEGFFAAFWGRNEPVEPAEIPGQMALGEQP